MPFPLHVRIGHGHAPLLALCVKFTVRIVVQFFQYWSLAFWTAVSHLVAKIFERKTGLKIYQVKKMFRHPLYPFMLADVDYFITMTDGTKAVL